jgi:N-acylglucosamine 2-epimerase/mannose-6-phosphate isomerase
MDADVTQNSNDLIRCWLFDEALPFWAHQGVDRSFGGYVERLRPNGTDAAASFKRTRVTCRQIYVFSHAALLGRQEYLDLARHGYEFLTRRTWQGPARGWARLLDREGRVADATPDLYDNAFALFALGWFYRATADQEVRERALLTLDFLEQHMRHPGGQGYLSEKPAAGYRKQNPHMHLLEAALINLEASQDARFRQVADEMVALFCGHFFDPVSGTLAEQFGGSWERAPGEAGGILEPGHHFEWAWLLAAYQRATGRDMRTFVRALVNFAEAHGVDPQSGATYNMIKRDGTPLNRGSRTWPNTERLKAAIALFELEARDPRPVIDACTRLLFKRYLACTPRGTWIDEFSADGEPEADTVPASTLYHLCVAFTEMLRVEDAVARAFPARRSAP